MSRKLETIIESFVFIDPLHSSGKVFFLGSSEQDIELERTKRGYLGVEIHTVQVEGVFIEAEVFLAYNTSTDAKQVESARSCARKFIRQARKNSYSNKYK